MAIRREVLEGILEQGSGEGVVYTLTTTPWGSSPTDIAVTATCAGVDVSDDVIVGTYSLDGDVITLPKIRRMTTNKQYRISVAFTVGSNDFVAYLRLNAKE